MITTDSLTLLSLAIPVSATTGALRVLNVIGVAPVTSVRFDVVNGEKFRLTRTVLAIVIGALNLVVFLKNVLK